jgi:ABC transporter with metal-binding/Fe-S-binding domain ATP-binding protein
MKIAILFSGGKDSTFAMFKAMKEHEVSCLISIISSNPESYMFHVPNIHLVEMQADALDIPLMLKKTKGIKEDELKDLKGAISDAKQKYKIEGIVTGAVKSVYQASRIQKICDDLGLKCINPLWQMNQVELLRELLKNNFKVIISGIFAYPLDEKWLGRIIDSQLIDKLAKLQTQFQLNPSGEGGEIETTVLDCPLFKKRIEILDSTIEYGNYAGVFIIKKAKLVEK